MTDEYNSLVYVVKACTILFLSAIIFFRVKKAVYNLSEWMIVQVATFVVVTNCILFVEGIENWDTKLS